MNEELFRGLWGRAVDVDEQLSAKAAPAPARARGIEVMDYLGGYYHRHPLHLPADWFWAEAADMSLDLHEDLLRIAGWIGSSDPDVLWDFFRGGLFL